MFSLVVLKQTHFKRPKIDFQCFLMDEQVVGGGGGGVVSD